MKDAFGLMASGSKQAARKNAPKRKVLTDEEKESREQAKRQKKEAEERKARIDAHVSEMIKNEEKREQDLQIQNEERNRHEGETEIAVDLVSEFLQNPPYFGRSAFSDKEVVTEALRDKATNRYMGLYDRERKQFGTRDVATLERLLRTGAWWPDGLERDAPTRQTLQRMVGRRVEVASMRAEAKSKVKREDAVEPAAAAAPSEPAASQPVPVKVEVLNVVQRDAKEKEKLASSGILDPTREDALAVSRLGLDRDAIDRTFELKYDVLGPRVGTSLETRILRWLEMKRMGVRQEPRIAHLYFDEEALKPHMDACDRHWARQISEVPPSQWVEHEVVVS